MASVTRPRRGVRRAVGQAFVNSLDEIAAERRQGNDGWALALTCFLVYFTFVGVAVVCLVALGIASLVLNGLWLVAALLASPFAFGWLAWVMTDPEQDS